MSSVIIPIWQMRKLRQRERVQKFTHGDELKSGSARI